MEIRNRRLFLHIILIAMASFFIFIWNKLTLNHLRFNEKTKQRFPFNKNKAVTFNDDYIVINNDNSTITLSSHCTHLGCKIDKMENGKIVCPCHGSEYDLNGQVLKGPAYKNLKPVNFSISDDGKNITIES